MFHSFPPFFCSFEFCYLQCIQVACADLLVLFEWQMLCMILLAAKTPVKKRLSGSSPQIIFNKDLATIKKTRSEVKFFESSPCLESMITLLDAEIARLEDSPSEAMRYSYL